PRSPHRQIDIAGTLRCARCARPRGVPCSNSRSGAVNCLLNFWASPCCTARETGRIYVAVQYAFVKGATVLRTSAFVSDQLPKIAEELLDERRRKPPRIGRRRGIYPDRRREVRLADPQGHDGARRDRQDRKSVV